MGDQKRRASDLLQMSNGIVNIRVAGIFRGIPTNELLQEWLQVGDTPSAVLARLDKKKVLGRKFFSSLMKQNQIVILLNGERLETADTKRKRLEADDEISVLSAIAGG
jgi:molybdopterin converting factor small subunit